MNLKPVWFYQESLAGGTSAALYDAGSLVIWWMGIPAMAFVSWMAFRRRSLALTLIAVGFAAQWIPWARIDRAAFQYHYYTALPFVVLALAYFVGRAVARRVAPRLGAGPDRRRRSRSSARRRCGSLAPAVVRVRRRRIGQPGVAGLPGRHPGDRPDLADSGARSWSSGSAWCFIVRRFLAFQAGGRRSGRGRPAHRRPSGRWSLTGRRGGRRARRRGAAARHADPRP